ncbi:DUF1992 domain-containing protein [Paenibacillus sp. NEAU-GSW1]|uniref:DnaJ family domain-containing protein n=1 Tax=Paenibacillus sp. NEAU-GSW1 TaxID=2682486 RepID=UPI00139EE3AB|nr:DUF1992 domain-containing protein [Paenibacillus sp. NEAU-GSW1]
MDWLSSLVEQRIQEAMAKGEFDNLPGKGKPLELEDLSFVPEDLRVSFKLLKNAGVVPEEMALAKEMVTLQELLDLCKDEKERNSLTRKLNEKRLRYRMMMEARGWSQSSAFTQYETQIIEKIERTDENDRNN